MMKPIKKLTGLSALSSECQLCFGTAAGCFVIGAIGYAVNALTVMETTLTAFLVMSGIYLLFGVISWFKSSPKYVPIATPAKQYDPRPSMASEKEKTLVETAA
jgi:hypothetical protein